MESSEIVARHATFSDIVQCCEILNFYILNSSKALSEHPMNVVDLANVLSKNLELGYPFVVLTFKELPHRVIGFQYFAENARAIKAPHLTAAMTFVREDMRSRGLITIIDQFSSKVVLESDIRGTFSFINRTNFASLRSTERNLTQVELSYRVLLRNGGYKHGSYLNLAIYFHPRKILDRLYNLREHL
jgi:L-amino acid N-acyltransferase YncA